MPGATAPECRCPLLANGFRHDEGCPLPEIIAASVPFRDLVKPAA